jgi:hypothetical protein
MAIQSDERSVGSAGPEQLIVGFAVGTVHSPSTAQKPMRGNSQRHLAWRERSGPAQSGFVERRASASHHTERWGSIALHRDPARSVTGDNPPLPLQATSAATMVTVKQDLVRRHARDALSGCQADMLRRDRVL